LASLFPSRAEALRRTVALKLYYSQAREDNFTTATQAGKQSAIDAGYQFIRNEGYVYRTRR
jgi:hypothetical protein